MEENQVEKFDPSQLMEGVKSRIKSTFVSLIPDTQWEEMCKSEMDKFFKVQYKKDYNGRDTTERIPSEFEKIVTDLMREKCKEYLKELLAKPEYKIESIWQFNNNTNIGGNKVTLSEHLDSMIKEKMPDMMNAMLSSIMADSFYILFNNVRNKLGQ